MNGRATRQHRPNVGAAREQRGVALLLFLLVLLVASSAYLVRQADSKVSAQQMRLAKGTQALATAKAALIAYAVQDGNRPGSMPCPDFDSDGESVPVDDYSGTTCKSLLGWFPYRTLDMHELRDDSGAKLWYAVSNDYRMFWGSSTPPALNSETVGTLSVDALADVVAVILAPGAAFAAQSRPGSSDTRDAITDRGEFLEDLNADATLEDYVSTAGGDFNDRVMVITRAELMREVEKRVVGEVMGSLQAFRAAHGVFPWPVIYDSDLPNPPPNPRFKTNFRGSPGTTEGLLPRHFDDDMSSGFPSTFTVTWSNVTGAAVVRSGTLAVADLTSAPLIGGNPIELSVPEAQGKCYWDATNKITAARCEGVAVTIDMMALNPGGPEFKTYTGFDVISWTRDYEFTYITVAVGAAAIAVPGATTPRTRSVTTSSLGLGSGWEISETIRYDNGGTEVVATGTGTLQTTSTTAGNLTVSDIYYYLDEDSELPSWFVANDWHHLIYYSVAADYLGGGDGDCETSATCLALEVDAATTVASDVGIAVVSAGNAIGGQVRAGVTATLDQYVEDADAASNVIGPVVSYRPRGDAGNNDHVRALTAGAL